MKVIIAGGRDFNDYDLLCNRCDHYLKSISDVTIVSGTQRGADKLGERYASDRNLSVVKFYPKWGLYGKSAGILRNKQMADFSAMLIAFWDGHSLGTKNMIDTAKKCGLNVYIINY